MKRFVVWLVVLSFIAVPLMAQTKTNKKRRVRKPVVEQQVPQDSVKYAEQKFASGPLFQVDCETAKLTGEKEGSRETNRAGWFFVGLLFPLPGIIAASIADPGHPSQISMDDSGNPVCFENGYRSKKKSGRVTASLIGGIIGVGLTLWIISSSSNSSSSGY